MRGRVIYYDPPMNSAPAIQRLDGLLTPLGFSRRKQTWNRTFGPYVDVIDVQVSKAGDAMTVNAGVMHPLVYRTFWGKAPPGFVDEPSCTVRSRIGQLMEGKDIWWSASDDEVTEDVAAAVAEHVLGFLERMHTPAAMASFLDAAEVGKQKYPPPIIYLAILRHELGDQGGACTVLAELHRATSSAWQARIDEVSERLGCS